MSHGARSFIRDSGLLAIDSAIAAGLTGIFWLIVARVVPAREVGIASTVISAASLIALVSRLGADFAIPYYIPKVSSVSRVIRTAFICTLPVAAVLSLLAALGAQWWLPDFPAIGTGSGIIAFVVLSVCLLAINLFLALGIAISRVGLVIAQDIVQNGGRLLLWWALLTFTAIGTQAEGLVLASVVSGLGSVILGILFLLPREKSEWFHKETYQTVRSYAIRSHGTSLLATAPGFLLPVMSTAMVGPEGTAILSVCLMILILLGIFHSTFASISFAHGSRDEQSLNNLFPRLTWLTWAGIAVICIATFFLGPWALGLFGPIYSTGGSALLSVLTLSLFFSSATDYAIVRHRTNGSLKAVYIMMLGRFVGIILLSLLFVPYFGVIGFGYAQVLSSFLVFLFGLFIDPLQPFRRLTSR